MVHNFVLNVKAALAVLLLQVSWPLVLKSRVIPHPRISSTQPSGGHDSFVGEKNPHNPWEVFTAAPQGITALSAAIPGDDQLCWRLGWGASVGGTALPKDSGHQDTTSLYLADPKAPDQCAGRAGKVPASAQEANCALSALQGRLHNTQKQGKREILSSIPRQNQHYPQIPNAFLFPFHFGRRDQI